MYRIRKKREYFVVEEWAKPRYNIIFKEWVHCSYHGTVEDAEKQIEYYLKLDRVEKKRYRL